MTLHVILYNKCKKLKLDGSSKDHHYILAMNAAGFATDLLKLKQKPDTIVFCDFHRNKDIRFVDFTVSVAKQKILQHFSNKSTKNTFGDCPEAFNKTC